MAIILLVQVKPNCRVSSLEQMPDGNWLARLKSPPVDGKANNELITLVANHFRCPKSAVSIKSGKCRRTKYLVINSYPD